jgi:hypothetical protein
LAIQRRERHPLRRDELGPHRAIDRLSDEPHRAVARRGDDSAWIFAVGEREGTFHGNVTAVVYGLERAALIRPLPSSPGLFRTRKRQIPGDTAIGGRGLSQRTNIIGSKEHHKIWMGAGPIRRRSARDHRAVRRGAGQVILGKQERGAGAVGYRGQFRLVAQGAVPGLVPRNMTPVFVATC